MRKASFFSQYTRHIAIHGLTGLKHNSLLAGLSAMEVPFLRLVAILGGCTEPDDLGWGWKHHGPSRVLQGQL